VPPSEESSLRSRGEEYRRYQRETSSFVPWFPRAQST
jgi:steroid 5-alpha reductase family enzyme